jgi:hypothetical protein
VALLIALTVSACGSSNGDASSLNLLAGKKPLAEQGTTHAARLTDGQMAVAGDHWETDLSTLFSGEGAYVEYDLGSVQPIDAIFLQGDNNDRFEIWLAGDERDFRKVWTATTVRGAGMRERHVDGVDAKGRYLRVVSRPGDPAVSVSEVMVFSKAPSPFPPEVPTRKGSERGENTVTWWLWFTALASAVLLVHRKTWPRPVSWLVFAAITAFGIFVVKQTIDDYPPTDGVINVLRLSASVVAGAAVLRIMLWPKRMEGRFVTGSLAAMAAVSRASFYNFFYPQFLDAAENGRTYVHTWDMRVYFPTAKYFDELGFDGLYLASVKAYADDVPGALPHRIANTELRDLQTYDMTRVRDVLDQVHAVKDRFSPERWEEFRQDMAYFRETMGSGGYLGSLRDHGGNATPAWMLVAHLLFRYATANDTTLLMAGALDPLLLLLFFVVAWRTFGLRTSLVCLVVYGTTTFPWFGSNWAGSTLRNDWMVLLGLGACALRAERPFVGGAALAGAAMIRAFPAPDRRLQPCHLVARGPQVPPPIASQRQRNLRNRDHMPQTPTDRTEAQIFATGI